MARDTCLRTVKAASHYTVYTVKIYNKQTSSHYKATNTTYTQLYKSAIFPKYILQYESGNTETDQGFGKRGMSRAILCAAGRHMTPLVVVVLLLLFISWCGLNTTKRKEEYTSCYNGFGLKVLLSDDHIAIFKILL